MDEMNNMNEVTMEENSAQELVPSENVGNDASGKTELSMGDKAIYGLAAVGGVYLAAKAVKGGAKLFKKVFPNAHLPACFKGKKQENFEEPVEVEATEVTETEEED